MLPGVADAEEFDRLCYDGLPAGELEETFVGVPAPESTSIGAEVGRLDFQRRFLAWKCFAVPYFESVILKAWSFE